MNIKSNSKVSSTMLFPFAQSERSRIISGAYVGKTVIYRAPFFFDNRDSINPHMLVAGTSGSGKTYFLKNYLARVSSTIDNILIIDWNGEYEELVAFLGGTSLKIEEGLPNDLFHGFKSVNISHLNSDTQREDAANSIVKLAVEHMHAKPLPVPQDDMSLIVLDEAWKLLGEHAGLPQLFREGRKYGIGVVIATQLLADAPKNIVGNAANMVVFRLQSEEDANKLLELNLVTQEEATKLTSLDRGSCFIKTIGKNEQESGALFIKKVEGIQTNTYKMSVNKMKTQITQAKLFAALDSLELALHERARVMSLIDNPHKSFSLHSLISLLYELGKNRASLIHFLRMLNVDDLTLVKVLETAKKPIRSTL